MSLAPELSARVSRPAVLQSGLSVGASASVRTMRLLGASPGGHEGVGGLSFRLSRSGLETLLVQRDTRLQHLGEDRQLHLGAAVPPIFRTSLFTFPDVESIERSLHGEDRERFLYSRNSNPTTRVLERKIADIESTEDAIAFSSGMAAISAVLLGLLSRGDHLILQASAYGPTLAFAHQILPRFGIEVTFLAAKEFDRVETHFRPTTRLVYAESPASVTFDIVDIEKLAAAARTRGVAVAVDNSWATPLFQQPARLGVDLVIHSGTKYIGGHSDILLGLVAGGGAPFSAVRSIATSLGAALSPEDAFLAVRGLRTLPLRMRKHEESGLEVARWLEKQGGVVRVLHPGLPSHSRHEIARRQMQGSSGLFSFQIRGDARRFVNALKLFSIGVSWGGHESLALPAVSMFPPDPEPEGGRELGKRPPRLRSDIPPGLIRLSIGLEDPKDLIADLQKGFGEVGLVG